MAYKSSGKMGNAPECGGDADNTKFNHEAAKGSAQRISAVNQKATDYSIPGKKRGSYKQDAD